MNGLKKFVDQQNMEKVLQIVCLMCVTSVLPFQTEAPCRLKKFDAGYVCVCSDDYCDTLNIPQSNNENEWMLVTSTESGQRFNFSFGEFRTQYDSKQTNSSETFMEINQSIMHQKIVGFGGSFTGAVSFILSKLSTKLRECIYTSYFGNDDGVGYSMLRLPIGGCDFDLEPWTYNEFPVNDFQLSNFSELHPKDGLRTELIRECMNVSKNFDIKIVGVTWSPPKWMKMKEEWSGKNCNQLKLEHYQTWADYHLKWLDLMHSAGISIFAISTGNEPHFADRTPFMGLSWNARAQATWISQHLVPTLKNSKHSNVQIHTFDDNRDVILTWLDEMNAGNKSAMDHISAFGVHGYFDKVTSPHILDSVKAKYPNILILYTEMCFGVTGPISSTGPILGSWSHFEELTNMLMETLLHNVNGYIDWNIILDASGGPNYIHNVVDAMIIASEDFKEIYKQPLFYAAAHFIKFIIPGSRRIEANVIGVNAMNLSSLAFLRPDDKIAAIFYNNNNQKSVSLKIIDKLKGALDIQIEPKSLNSLIYSI